MCKDYKNRFYKEHFHCYQYNILDKWVQDDDGNDWIIGTANGENDADEIVLLLNILNEERYYFENGKEEFLSKWSIAHAENIQLREENQKLIEQLEDRIKYTHQLENELRTGNIGESND